MTNVATFFSQLLAKAIIRFGRNQTVAQAYGNATRLSARLRYIVRVLEAPRQYRAAVREVLEADGTDSKLQFAALIHFFELLSPNEKLNFLVAFKTAGTVGGQAPFHMATHTTFQGGSHPPIFVP